MKLLLVGFASLLAGAAFAQPPADAVYPRLAQAEIPKTDSVPTGGCMPIGLTARGDLVFPMQCRELIERERGQTPEQQPPLPAPQSQQEPSVKVASPVDSEKVDKSQLRERADRKKLSIAERKKKKQSPDSDPQTTGSTRRN